MKRHFIWFGALCGAFVGLFASIPDSLGVKLILAGIGAVAGIAMGGAIAGIGVKGCSTTSYEDDALAGLGVTPDDLARNYWRDRGRPPLSSPLQPEHRHHQFDPDKL